MNYMAKIAEMLGVELGEVFCMKHPHFHRRLQEYKITENGFLVLKNKAIVLSKFQLFHKLK